MSDKCLSQNNENGYDNAKKQALQKGRRERQRRESSLKEVKEKISALKSKRKKESVKL